MAAADNKGVGKGFSETGHSGDSQTEGQTNEVRRLHEIREKPELAEVEEEEIVPGVEDKPEPPEFDKKVTGIVTSVAKGALRLNEQGQVFSYELAKDATVHYPGGVTGIMDLRPGDNLTLYLNRISSQGEDAGYRVSYIEKHTESVDR